jgi:hypothetical protein
LRGIDHVGVFCEEGLRRGWEWEMVGWRKNWVRGRTGLEEEGWQEQKRNKDVLSPNT